MLFGGAWCLKFHLNNNIHANYHVTKRNTHVKGTDNQEIFSPAVQITTLYCLSYVQNAFFHDDIDEKVYMDPPSWLYDEEKTWYVSSINLCMDYNKPHVISFLDSSSYPKGQFSANQKRLFSFNQSSRQVFLLHYMYTLMICSWETWNFSRITFLNNLISVVIWNIFSLMLKHCISKSQKKKKYALDILQDVGFQGAWLDKFPVEQHLKLTLRDGEQHLKLIIIMSSCPTTRWFIVGYLCLF